MEQILRNNKHIRVDEKPQFCKKSLMAGISRIKDIFFTNGKLKTWNFFSEKGHNLNNYLLILGLSKAIPESWRVLLNSGTTCCSQTPDSDLMDFTELIFHSMTGDSNLIELTSKKLYWILVEDIRVHPTARLKYIEDITRWREDMNFMSEWQEQYLTSSAANE